MEGDAPPRPQQGYRYVVVLDLEATCEEVRNPALNENRLTHEIIEFPWAVVDLKCAEGPRVVAQRQLYVRPEWEANRQLSAFCTKLTGITDAVLAEQGRPLAQCLDIFDQAMRELQQTAEGHADRDDLICVATDGDWDLDMQLRSEAAAKGLDVPRHLRRFINVREEVAHFYKPGREHHLRGLKSLLRYLGLPHQGRHHSGIDDVLNISQIVLRLAADGHAFTPERAKVVGSTDAAALAAADLDFSKWWTADELTPEALSVLMGFRPEEVFNIYQFGSRVYEPDDSQDAHWSFIIAMGDDYKGPANFTRGNVHARVGPLWKFEESLRHNDLYQVISLSLPPRFVWKETVRFDMSDRLNLRKLYRSVLEQFNAQTRYKLARSFKMEGPKLFVKEVLRMFRSVMFGIQLLDEGKVVDYSQANAYQTEIEAMGELTEQNWIKVIDRFKPELERLLSVLRAKVEAEQADFCRLLDTVNRDIQQCNGKEHETNDSAHGFRVLRAVLRQKGAGALVRHLPVCVQRNGSLVQLCCDEDELRLERRRQGDDDKERPPDLIFPDLHSGFDGSELSPLAALVARQCHGAIFDEADDYRVVSLPFPRFDKPSTLDSIQQRVNSSIEWGSVSKPACVMPKLNGALYVLYAHNGDWTVSSQTSMSADDQIHPPFSDSDTAGSDGATCALRDAFWSLWNASRYSLPPITEQGRRCFLFQLAAEGLGVFAGIRLSEPLTEEDSGCDNISMDPVQRDLTALARLRLPRLIYLGTGCLDTLRHQLSYESDQFAAWERPPKFVGVGSSEALLRLLMRLPPTVASGVVIASGDAVVWLDSPVYVHLLEIIRLLRAEPSEEVMYEVLRRTDSSREDTAVLARFPQFAALYASVSRKLWHLIDRVDAEYQRVGAECAAELRAHELRQAASQAQPSDTTSSGDKKPQAKPKDPAHALFARKVGGRHPFKQVLFAMHRDHITAAQYFRACLAKVLVLNLKADEAEAA